MLNCHGVYQYESTAHIWFFIFDKKGGIEMKLVNAAITTLKDMVGPSAMNGCTNCLDACQCTDPDSCKYD